MKVTAEAEARKFANALAEAIQQACQILPVVMIAIIGMRSGHNVLNAVRRSHSAHLFRGFPRLRAVVHVRKDMAMNVNHSSRFRQELIMPI